MIGSMIPPITPEYLRRISLSPEKREEEDRAHDVALTTLAFERLAKMTDVEVLLLAQTGEQMAKTECQRRARLIPNIRRQDCEGE